jgi:flavin-binding protein dodecin
MKKIIYGFVITASIVGTYAENYCPSELSKKQMGILAEKGEVEIEGRTYKTSNQQIIKNAVDRAGKMSKILRVKAENVKGRNAVENDEKATCFYQFRSTSQSFHNEPPVEFTISSQLN